MWRGAHGNPPIPLSEAIAGLSTPTMTSPRSQNFDEERQATQWQGDVPPDQAGRRLDQVLAELVPGLSRAQVQRLIREGRCLLNGGPATPSERLKAGAHLRLQLAAPQPTVAPENLALDVLHEDEALLVVDKPAGMAAHPARGTPAGTLLNAIAGHLGPHARPTLVHRLDKDTAGAIVAAKTVQAHSRLQQQIHDGELKRTYWALVWGVPSPATGQIRQPIARDRGDKRRMAVAGHGKHAITHYRVLRRYRTASEGITLVQANLQTGRTHQIRVHFEWAGHPLVGERTYGGDRRELSPLDLRLPGQALFSRSVQFRHPSTGRPLAVTAPVPEALLALLDELAPA